MGNLPALKTFFSVFLRLETGVAGLFYAIAAGLLFADIVGRELFSSPLWGAQRMAVLLANGAALIGIGVAVGLNRHIRPTVLDGLIPERYVGIITRLGHSVAAVVFFVGAYYGALLVLDNRLMGFTTPPLDLQIWIAQLALPYGLATAGLRSLIFAGWPELQPKAQGVI